MLTLEEIRQARARLGTRLHRTPLIHSTTLSRHLGAKVSLKLECFQKTGSFKPRGAFNKLLTLSEAERQRGVVAVSGGNHAQGVAFAAAQLGIRSIICMPRSTPTNYVEATQHYGAEIVFCQNIREAFAEAEARQAAGLTLIHPFDDPLIAAGQGTIGIEIIEDAPDATHVYLSIGGGGLLAGVGTALKELRSQVQLVGVETDGADAMSRALAAGAPVELPAITSIARTLGAPQVSPFTLEAVRRLAREVVVVRDAEAVAALYFLLERVKILTEPAASCCLAAARRHRFSSSDHVVLLLCGGNASLEDLCSWRRLLEVGEIMPVQ